MSKSIKRHQDALQINKAARDPLSDVQRVIAQHHIPMESSKQVQKELALIPDEVQETDCVGRQDFTFLPFITIDGVTAKDFDDAICVKKTSKGFQAYIAIADVGHYVKPHTTLDHFAYQRGNSTYFPQSVAAMLPEKLSNGICSLNPHVQRLAIVVALELDQHGQVVSSKFYEGVIQTVARTTYEEIQALLDGHVLDHLSHICHAVFDASDLAKLLLSQRVPRVSLDLDLLEGQVIVDKDGYAVDIQIVKRLFSHRMIEELMLLANVTVARFLKKHKMPAIYRVHERPDAKDVITLNDFLKHLGSSVEIHKDHVHQKKLNKVLKKFKGTHYEPVLNITVLRTMKQAFYSAKDLGHFGLGFPDYVHFTSPIRRYADLIVHRQLKYRLGLSSQKYDFKDLETMGVHLSACEQRSVKAERQVMAIKKARLMENLISQEFQGIITSITRFGVFILLTEFDMDGMLRLSDIARGRFIFDDKYLSLQNRRTKQTYCVGDLIRVVIDRVDVITGKVGFTLPLKDHW